MIVDYQCHWFPKARFEELLDRPQDRYPRTERSGDGYLYWHDAETPIPIKPYFYDLDQQLADMDAHGVDVALMAPALFGEVMDYELGEAREVLAFVNEESARVVKELPERRRGLAMLPMQDTAAAIETLDDAIGRLGLCGVSMISNVAGRPLATEETLPVFERIAELGVPLVLHPPSRSGVCEKIREIGRIADISLAWVVETSTAALSLIYSGVFEKCPELTVVHPHLGGVLPYLTTRFETCRRIHRPDERELGDYLRAHFYTDTVNHNPGAIEMSIETYGAERILFATDYPWVAREETDAQLASITPEIAAQIRSNQIPGLDLPNS